MKSKKNDNSWDYAITIDLSDKQYLYYIESMIKSTINTKTSCKTARQRGNRIPRMYLWVRNKDLFKFFNENVGIPKGAKSSIVCVPKVIEYSSYEIKKYFLAGYFDTDGGFRGNTLGFCTTSKNLNKGIHRILEEFYVKHSVESWINKKYKKEHYGIKLNPTEIGHCLFIGVFIYKQYLGYFRGDNYVSEMSLLQIVRLC